MAIELACEGGGATLINPVSILLQNWDQMSLLL
jgi:hypothetical protein